MKRLLTWMLAGLVMCLTLVMSGSAAYADYLAEDTNLSEESSRDKIESYLESDRYMPSRLELRKYSRDVVADLIALAQQRSTSLGVRGRAIQALALYRSDKRAKQAVAGLLRSLKPGHKVYPAVIVAYGEIFGEQAVDALAKLAAHKRSHVRMAAVVALGRFGGSNGLDVLQSRLNVERHATIKKRIASYVQ